MEKWPGGDDWYRLNIAENVELLRKFKDQQKFTAHLQNRLSNNYLNENMFRLDGPVDGPKENTKSALILQLI